MFRGHEGFLKRHRQWLEAWGDFRVLPEEFPDLGDRVLLIAEVRGRGRAGGVELRNDFAVLWVLDERQGEPGGAVPQPFRRLKAVGAPL